MTEVRRKPTLGVLILGVAVIAALLATFGGPNFSLAGPAACVPTGFTGPTPTGPSGFTGPPCYPLHVPSVEGSADASERALPALDQPAGSDSGFPVGIAALAAGAVLIQAAVAVGVRRRRAPAATDRS